MYIFARLMQIKTYAPYKIRTLHSTSKSRRDDVPVVRPCTQKQAMSSSSETGDGVRFL